VDEPEAQAYRKGQPLDVRAGVSGWAAPCISGWPLGWGKASDGSLKNHYPKGLRVYS
jgi:NOL1/NOP2/fmu family ribosome biogenesis protein